MTSARNITARKTRGKRQRGAPVLWRVIHNRSLRSHLGAPAHHRRCRYRLSRARHARIARSRVYLAGARNKYLNSVAPHLYHHAHVVRSLLTLRASRWPNASVQLYLSSARDKRVWRLPHRRNALQHRAGDNEGIEAANGGGIKRGGRNRRNQRHRLSCHRQRIIVTASAASSKSIIINNAVARPYATCCCARNAYALSRRA